MHINQHTAIALRMRANYIETGDVNYSKHEAADTLRALRQATDPSPADKDNARVLEHMCLLSCCLTLEQSRLIEQLRERAAQVEME
jgi:hypothetical protein